MVAVRLNKKTEMAEFLFHQGTNYKTYEYLGAHKVGGEIVFRVWAPSAEEVFLAGDFNEWGTDTPLERKTEGGVWEIKLPEAKLGKENFKYKYVIRRNGRDIYKADPYGYFCECPPRPLRYFTSLPAMNGRTMAG